MPDADNYSFLPLTSDRWPDFEELFGEHGAYGGCWCMWWRSTRREFESRAGDGNREAMKSLVEQGEVPGVLAYDGRKAFGWSSIAPRERFGSLERSPVLRRLDETPVWSLVCFYLDRVYRNKGLMGVVLEGAVSYAASQGARVIEAYPTITRGRQLAPVSSFMGIPEVFLQHGFEVVAQPSKSRQIMRRIIR